jgi:hypothetical protein
MESWPRLEDQIFPVCTRAEHERLRKAAQRAGDQEDVFESVGFKVRLTHCTQMGLLCLPCHNSQASSLLHVGFAGMFLSPAGCSFHGHDLLQLFTSPDPSDSDLKWRIVTAEARCSDRCSDVRQVARVLAWQQTQGRKVE